MQKNYSMTDVGNYQELGGTEAGRVELRSILGLTGCAVSLNRLPANEGSSFLHTHKRNEEVYIVISGSGQFKADDEILPIKEGSAVRVSPDCVRAIKAGADGMAYLCIQADQGSLKQEGRGDGVIVEGAVLWD